MTVLRNRFIADVIHKDEVILGPKSDMTGGLIWTQTCTQGEFHVKVKAEIGVRLPEAKERQRLPETMEARRDRFPLTALRRNQLC